MSTPHHSAVVHHAITRARQLAPAAVKSELDATTAVIPGRADTLEHRRLDHFLGHAGQALEAALGAATDPADLAPIYAAYSMARVAFDRRDPKWLATAAVDAQALATSLIAKDDAKVTEQRWRDIVQRIRATAELQL